MSDFLAAVDLVMAKPSIVGALNISSGQGHTIKDIYDLVRAHLTLAPDPGVRVEPVGVDDVAQVVVDPSRSMEMLGWRPRVDFPTTIGRMLSWYDTHGVTDVYSHLAPAKQGRGVGEAARIQSRYEATARYNTIDLLNDYKRKPCLLSTAFRFADLFQLVRADLAIASAGGGTHEVGPELLAMPTHPADAARRHTRPSAQRPAHPW